MILDNQEHHQSSGKIDQKHIAKGSKRKNMQDFLIKKNVGRNPADNKKKVSTANSDIEGIITKKNLAKVESKKAQVSPNKQELSHQKAQVPVLPLQKGSVEPSHDEDEFERKLKHMRAMSLYKNTYQYKTIEN